MVLKYDYKEDYRNNSKIEKAGEGHAKREQCMFVENKISEILNTNRYKDLEDFINNNYTLEAFLQNNSDIQTALKHVNTFGNPINEEDYEKIKNNFREITKQKQTFETKDIKTTKIDDKSYNSLNIEDKTHYLDSSTSNNTIKKDMEDIQSTQIDFQTTDAKKNSENIFKELEERHGNLNLQNLDEIDYDSLSEEKKELYKFSIDYQATTTSSLKIDLEKGVIVDESNNVMKINKSDGELSIVKDEGGVQVQESVQPIKNNNDLKNVNTDFDKIKDNLNKLEDELKTDKQKIDPKKNANKDDLVVKEKLIEDDNLDEEKLLTKDTYEDEGIEKDNIEHQKQFKLTMNNNNY